MIFKTPTLLFATLNEEAAAAFERYIRFTGKEYEEGALFKLYRNPTVIDIRASQAFTLTHLNQLKVILEEKSVEELANLILQPN